MKLVIADYSDVLGRELEREISYLQARLPHADVVIHPYTDEAAFCAEMRDADGLLTAFLPLGEAQLAQMPRLRAISINATGYNFVDLKAARARGIVVCAIGEYCTNEVADHTLALLLALERSLKQHSTNVETRGIWQYYAAMCPMGLAGRTIGLFGFGKIGRAVAVRAQAFGMRVIAADPYADAAAAQALGVRLVSEEELLAQSHVISNHMNLTVENEGYFTDAVFAQMEKRPIFLNVARGGSVDEAALVRALDSGQIRAAGLDVLRAEKPDLAHTPLARRDNVIVTPHAAFYSEQSIDALQRISCDNLSFCLLGETDKAFRVVSK